MNQICMMENKNQKNKKTNKQDVRNDERTFAVEPLITFRRRAGTLATMGFGVRSLTWDFPLDSQRGRNRIRTEDNFKQPK